MNNRLIARNPDLRGSLNDSRFLYLNQEKSALIPIIEAIDKLEQLENMIEDGILIFVSKIP